MAFELKSGEEVLADIGANLIRGVEAVGGRLRVTNTRLIFEAHSFNLQKMPAEILREHIADVQERNTLWVVPNGILIRTRSGVEYKFVVWNRKRLIKILSPVRGRGHIPENNKVTDKPPRPSAP
jgi:hypothetical protein